MKSKFALLLMFCGLLLSCSKNSQPEYKVIIVKVPPMYDGKLTNEENYWSFQRFLFPQIKIPNPIPKDLPNDDSLLWVKINDTGKLQLNGESEGDISNTINLTKRLKLIFQEREKNNVYEPNSQQIVKAVGIRTAPSIKYGDFINVIDAINQSGANPIVLLSDNDANVMQIKNNKF